MLIDLEETMETGTSVPKVF